jgi:hypothetical protein
MDPSETKLSFVYRTWEEYVTILQMLHDDGVWHLAETALGCLLFEPKAASTIDLVVAPTLARDLPYVAFLADANELILLTCLFRSHNDGTIPDWKSIFVLMAKQSLYVRTFPCPMESLTEGYKFDAIKILDEISESASLRPRTELISSITDLGVQNVLYKREYSSGRHSIFKFKLTPEELSRPFPTSDDQSVGDVAFPRNLHQARWYRQEWVPELAQSGRYVLFFVGGAIMFSLSPFSLVTYVFLGSRRTGERMESAIYCFILGRIWEG